MTISDIHKELESRPSHNRTYNERLRQVVSKESVVRIIIENHARCMRTLKKSVIRIQSYESLNLIAELLQIY